MNKTIVNKHEEGLILILLITSILVLAWLFTPFLPALFISMLISISTYNFYQKLNTKLPKKASSIIMTFICGIIIVLPLSYIILFIAIKLAGMSELLQQNLQIDTMQKIANDIIYKIIPEKYQANILIEESFNNNIGSILNAVQGFLITVVKTIASISGQIIFFFVLTVFALYYFYIDGVSLLNKIKKVSPMDKNINNILIKQFSGLSITLMSSIFIVSMLQGLVFFMAISIFTDLPALFLGVAIAMAGFIPVLGSMLVWLPITIYLFAIGETIESFIILFVGAVLVATIIDNIIRPIIIHKIADKMNHKIAMNHTLITVLSIIAGVIKFNILGLFIGPIIASIAITMIDIYKIKYR